MNSTPTIFFRCDASKEQGSGHAMRCLTLAGVMKARGWSCSFLTNMKSIDTVPSLAEYPIVSTGYSHENVDMLIIDNYSLGASYATRARLWARHIMIIDDLANHAHDCDILLDQTFGRKKQDYWPFVPQKSKILCGSNYTILRSQFLEHRAAALQKRPVVQGIKEHTYKLWCD